MANVQSSKCIIQSFMVISPWHLIDLALGSFPSKHRLPANACPWVANLSDHHAGRYITGRNLPLYIDYAKLAGLDARCWPAAGPLGRFLDRRLRFSFVGIGLVETNLSQHAVGGSAWRSLCLVGGFTGARRPVATDCRHRSRNSPGST